ncbi:glutamate decarboxylase [Tanacetum coccineum]
MIAHLFHAPVGEDHNAVGVGIVGSSEAIMLAGLAFKRKWQAKRKSLGKTNDRPNIVTGSNVQVCWEKFARYFEVDLKEVRLKEENAASGGFVAPFLYPDLEWDFRLPLVKSINVSGHKYGLVYACVGWVVWRTKEDFPDELVFHINYLGSDQPTFTLNFSKGKVYLQRMCVDNYHNLLVPFI